MLLLLTPLGSNATVQIVDQRFPSRFLLNCVLPICVGVIFCVRVCVRVRLCAHVLFVCGFRMHVHGFCPFIFTPAPAKFKPSMVRVPAVLDRVLEMCRAEVFWLL